MDPCAPPCCDPCQPKEVPCVSRKALLSIKRYHIKPTPECGIENCVMLRNFDVPYHGGPFKNKLKSPRDTLGRPIGFIHSNYFIRSDIVTNKLIMDRFGAMMKAFAKLYILDEMHWKNETLDDILKEGEHLASDSLEDDMGDYESLQPQIESETKVKREFDSNNNIFEIDFDQKFVGIFEGKRVYYDDEAIDSETGMPFDEAEGNLPLTELRRIMKDFFKDAKFGLVHFRFWHLLVWKAHQVFFVLDLFGRRLDDLQSDHEGNGFATMMALKSLDNVIWLITGCSDLELTDTFHIREVKMVRLVGPDRVAVTRSFAKRKNDYEIIRKDYAILRSNLHASLNRANIFRNRGALPVGIAAILASKIDHPATWSTPDLDKIICYGFNVCRECVNNCMNGEEPINLSNLPTNLRLGQFWVAFQLDPNKYSGVWKCVPYQKQGQLYGALKQAFDDGETGVLVQISFQMYAIIKKKNFYYLLDPYLHKIKGIEESVAADPKSASLRMFCNFDTMMEVFHDILLQNTRTNRFFIHTLKIKKIINPLTDAKRVDEEDCMETLSDEKDEVASLNEYICFQIDDRRCLDEFGQPTDFEEEEEEIPWSEYEEEEMPGEEEEGTPEKGPAALAAEHLESASSGDEGQGGKRRKRKGKKRKSSKKDAIGGDNAGGGEGQTTKEADKPGKTDGTKTTSPDAAATSAEKGPTQTETQKGPIPIADSLPQSKPFTPTEPSTKDKKKEPEGKGKEKKQEQKGDQKKTEAQKKADSKALRSELLKAKMNKDKLSACFADRLQARDEALENALEALQKKVCKPDDEKKKKYPTYSPTAHDLCVVGSECGTYEDICRVVRNSFRCSDRILLIVPWGSYVIFETVYNINKKMYYLFSGCTCDINRFRYIDLSCGTEGLVPFPNLHDLITYLIDSCAIRESMKESRKRLIDDVCRQFN